MKRFILVLAAAASVLFLSTFAGAKDYTIGTGDILSIRVWGEDSLGADVKGLSRDASPIGARARGRWDVRRGAVRNRPRRPRPSGPGLDRR